MPDKLERLIQLSPHNRFLGLQLSEVDGEVLTTKMEYRTELIGNPDSGVLHGGAVTAMLDTTCGGAVYLKLGALTRIATLDLRVDYLKPSTPKLTLYSSCQCTKLTQHVAFVEGTAYHLAEDGSRNEIARACGTFMLMLPKPGASL